MSYRRHRRLRCHDKMQNEINTHNERTSSWKIKRQTEGDGEEEEDCKTLQRNHGFARRRNCTRKIEKSS